MVNIQITDKKCPNCNNFTFNGSCTLKEYHSTCLNCDEDFFSFELY